MLTVEQEKMLEVAARIREMREISGLTVEEMANKVEVTVDDYLRYDNQHCQFAARHREGSDSSVCDYRCNVDQHNTQLAADLWEPGISEDGRRRGRTGHCDCKGTGINNFCSDLHPYKA